VKNLCLNDFFINNCSADATDTWIPRQQGKILAFVHHGRKPAENILKISLSSKIIKIISLRLYLYISYKNL
jgi:hypothetical protein